MVIITVFSSRCPLLHSPLACCVLRVLRLSSRRPLRSAWHGDLARALSIGLHLNDQNETPRKFLSHSCTSKLKLIRGGPAIPFSTSCSVYSRSTTRLPKWPKKTTKISSREEEGISEDEGLQEYLSSHTAQERSQVHVEKDPGFEETYIIGQRNVTSQRSTIPLKSAGSPCQLFHVLEDGVTLEIPEPHDRISSKRRKVRLRDNSRNKKEGFESEAPRYNDKLVEVDETVSLDLLDMETSRHDSWRKHPHEDNSNRPYAQKQSRDQLTAARGHDVLYGISPCLLALQHNKREVHQIYVTSSFRSSERSEVKEILSLVEERGLKMWHTNRRVLDKFSEQRPHQGICMETSRLYFTPLDDEGDGDLDSLASSVTLVLDQIKDPMNLGALLRSSYFLGIDKVIVSKKNCCSLTPVVSKASSGVMEIMPVYYKSHIPSFLEVERKRGWHIIGACVESYSSTTDITPCHKYNQTGPVVLVVGSEGFGLSSDIKKECSGFISIPAGRQLHAGIDSLNVSVATGILLHALMGRK